MKTLSLILLFLILLSSDQFGQTRIIHGRILDEDLEFTPSVLIQINDTLLIGQSDSTGRFKIEIPEKTDKLLFRWVGMEPTIIKLANNCDTVEFIMMFAVHYDFISNDEVDKLRFKRFKKLPKLYKDAIKRGLFIKQSICYDQLFIKSRS
jgi:hypothetical protein